MADPTCKSFVKNATEVLPNPAYLPSRLLLRLNSLINELTPGGETMALITRLSRLFQADIHAVLDRIEEPDTLLRQSMREMQEALDVDTRQIKRLQLEQGQLAARQAEVERSLKQIEEELDVCFTSDKEDLARKLIKRKLEAEQFGEFLSRKLRTLEEHLGEITAQVEENRTRLDSLRQQAELLTETENDTQSESYNFTPDFSVHEEDVEVAFLREKQRRHQS
jgi:phage shock protein A